MVFFHFCHTVASLLEFNEVWSLISKHFQETGRNMMEVISQVEHPVTSLPMYTPLYS